MAVTVSEAARVVGKLPRGRWINMKPSLAAAIRPDLTSLISEYSFRHFTPTRQSQGTRGGDHLSLHNIVVQNLEIVVPFPRSVFNYEDINLPSCY